MYGAEHPSRDAVNAVDGDNIRGEIARLIRQHDVYRGERLWGGSGQTLKEWSHFCVSSGELHLILNYSVPGPRAAVTALVRTREASADPSSPGRWSGELEMAAPQISDDGTQIRIAQSSLHFDNGRYLLAADLPGLRAALAVTPSVFPYLANNIHVGRSATFNWFAVPRALATGTVTVGDREWQLREATCYHDRNWGEFSWGNDFSWEWGYSLALAGQSPYTFVVSRISDRARCRTFAQALLVWRGRDLIRAFRSEEVSFEVHGRLAAGPCFSVPRAARLLSPGTATDVPKEWVVRAAADHDVLVLRCRMLDVGQILVPDDAAPGLTVINEVFGRMNVTGRLGGLDLNAEHDANFEFLSR